MSNQSGTGNGSPSQDRALEKTRREVKQLEESLRKQADENEKLRREIDLLKQENEKLKKELAAKRQPPKWAKPNKMEDQKKKGLKAGHSSLSSIKRNAFSGACGQDGQEHNEPMDGRPAKSI